MMTEFLEIKVRGSSKHPLSRMRRKEWKPLLTGFDEHFSVPYIIFLGEILKCFTGQKVVFSGFKKSDIGMGDECWNLRAGAACIYREKYSELSDGWQRVEVTGDRTEIIDAGNERILQWNGDYGDFSGMTIFLAGVSEEEACGLRKTAEDLFDEVNFSKILHRVKKN